MNECVTSFPWLPLFPSVSFRLILSSLFTANNMQNASRLLLSQEPEFSVSAEPAECSLVQFVSYAANKDYEPCDQSSYRVARKENLLHTHL